PPRPTLFPYTTLFRSGRALPVAQFHHAGRLAIEPAVVDLDLPDVHDAARAADERGGEPAGEADDERSQDGGAEPRDAEPPHQPRSEEHTSELQSRSDL